MVCFDWLCLWHWWGLAKVWCVNRQSAAGSYCAAPHRHTTTCEHRHKETQIKTNKNTKLSNLPLIRIQIPNHPEFANSRSWKKGSKLVWWLQLDGELDLEMAKIMCLLKIYLYRVSNHQNMIVYLESWIFIFWYWCYVWGYAVVSVWDYKWQ